MLTLQALQECESFHFFLLSPSSLIYTLRTQHVSLCLGPQYSEMIEMNEVAKNEIFIHMKSYVFLNFHVSKTEEYLSVNKTLKIYFQQKTTTINI